MLLGEGLFLMLLKPHLAGVHPPLAETGMGNQLSTLALHPDCIMGEGVFVAPRFHGDRLIIYPLLCR